jgi:hypothetical protein
MQKASHKGGIGDNSNQTPRGSRARHAILAIADFVMLFGERRRVLFFK